MERKKTSTLEEWGHKPDIEAIKRLNRRRRRRRIIKKACIIAIPVILIAAFLFSPWGPYSSAFFASDGNASDTGQQQAGSEVRNDVVEESGATVNADTAEAQPRYERVSDTSPPTVAIVVDDVGQDSSNLEKWLQIDAPITFSTLPYYAAAPELAERLYEAGFRIMLHIPTENEPPNSFAGEGQLATGMSRETVFATLDSDIAKVPHAAGVNNHQGGKGCNDLQLMTYMCEWAKERDLYVVDSDSSTNSQVTNAGASVGFPRRENQVFIDHQNEPDYIRSSMRRLANIARQEGTAIGICHFGRPNTPSVVGEMVRQLRAEGIHFAFVQDIHN